MNQDALEPNAFVRERLKSLLDRDPSARYDWAEFGPRATFDAIDDPALMPELARLIETTADGEVHFFVTHLAGMLWRNSNDTSIADYLVERVLAERRHDFAVHLLYALGGKALPRAERLAALLGKGKTRLWHHVLQVLQHCPEARCEDAVLFAFANSRSHLQRAQAARVLAFMGTEKSVPILKPHLYGKGDEAYPVCYAITAILGKNCEPFLRELLEDRKFANPQLVLWQMTKHCGPTAVPVVLQRLKLMTARTAVDQNHWKGSSTLSRCIEFLRTHAEGTSELLALYELLKKRWKRLVSTDREYLVAHVPQFSNINWRPDGQPVAPPEAELNVAQARALLSLRQGGGSVSFSDDSAQSVAKVHRYGSDRQHDIEALKHFPRLQELRLGCPLVDDDLRVVGAMAGLEHLAILHAQCLTDEGLRHLYRLRNLHSLLLGEAQLGDEGVQWLARLHGLVKLSLPRCPLTDERCRRLMDLTNLTSLDLSDTPISDVGLVGLERLRRLQSLRLNGTRITDATVERCLALNNLRWIVLADTQVTNEGLSHLATLQGLLSVAVHGTLVTPGFVERVRQECPSLQIQSVPLIT